MYFLLMRRTRIQAAPAAPPPTPTEQFAAAVNALAPRIAAINCALQYPRGYLAVIPRDLLRIIAPMADARKSRRDVLPDTEIGTRTWQSFSELYTAACSSRDASALNALGYVVKNCTREHNGITSNCHNRDSITMHVRDAIITLHNNILYMYKDGEQRSQPATQSRNMYYCGMNMICLQFGDIQKRMVRYVDLNDFSISDVEPATIISGQLYILPCDLLFSVGDNMMFNARTRQRHSVYGFENILHVAHCAAPLRKIGHGRNCPRFLDDYGAFGEIPQVYVNGPCNIHFTSTDVSPSCHMEFW